MDNQRLLIWAFFLLMGWMTWQTWQQDFAPRPAAPAAGTSDEVISAPDEAAAGDDLPAIAEPAGNDDVAPAVEPSGMSAAAAAPTIRVRTDVFEVVISTTGGTLQGATLTKYPVEKDRPDELVELLGTSGQNFALIESGVRVTGALFHTQGGLRVEGDGLRRGHGRRDGVHDRGR